MKKFFEIVFFILTMLLGAGMGACMFLTKFNGFLFALFIFWVFVAAKKAKEVNEPLN